MKDVVWKGRGASNTIAVQKSIEEANRLKIPVKSKHLERLQKFRTQVLNMEYPTCPLAWERHTESVKQVEDEYGVVWRDQDGYYCAPPGLEPDTLVPDEPEKKKTAHELKKEIEELTTTIQHTLDPEARAKYEEKEAEKDAIMSEIASRRQSASREHLIQKKKELAKRKEKEDTAHVKTLSKIYRETGQKKDAAEESAKSLLAVASRCVSGSGGAGCVAYEVVDKSVPGGKKTVYIPEMVMSSDEDEDSVEKLRLQKWWKAYRRASEAKKELERRKKDARYL
jgi:hypothetical protein